MIKYNRYGRLEIIVSVAVIVLCLKKQIDFQMKHNQNL